MALMRFLPHLAIASATALAGAALGKLIEPENILQFAAGGAAVAFLAIGAMSLFSSPASRAANPIPKHKLKGLAVMLGGFGIAMLGFVLASFVSVELGWYLGVVGVLTGAVGMVFHFSLMASE